MVFLNIFLDQRGLCLLPPKFSLNSPDLSSPQNSKSSIFFGWSINGVRVPCSSSIQLFLRISWLLGGSSQFHLSSIIAKLVGMCAWVVRCRLYQNTEKTWDYQEKTRQPGHRWSAGKTARLRWAPCLKGNLSRKGVGLSMGRMPDLG